MSKIVTKTFMILIIVIFLGLNFVKTQAPLDNYKPSECPVPICKLHNYTYLVNISLEAYPGVKLDDKEAPCRNWPVIYNTRNDRYALYVLDEVLLVDVNFSCVYKVFENDSEDAPCRISAYDIATTRNPCTFNCAHFENLKVEAIFNEEVSQIHFNVSWTPIDYINNKLKYITIYLKNKFSNSTITQQTLSTEESSLIFPSLDSSVNAKINHSDIYNFLIISNNDSCEIPFYKVPECVGMKCDCALYKPHVEVFDYTTSTDYLTFFWNVVNPNSNDHFYNITKMVILGIINRDNTHYHPGDWEVDFHNGKTKFNTDELVSGENYTLIVEFTNNFFCSQEATYSFFVPQVTISSLRLYSLCFIGGVTILVVIIIIKKKFIVKFAIKIGNALPHRNHSYRIPMQDNLLYTPIRIQEDVSEDVKEISRDNIELKELIGRGAFGQVFSAKAYRIEGIEPHKNYRMVAVKMLGGNVTSEAVMDFKSEIEIFKKIGDHPNIVKLLGYCTLEIPLLMVMEFVPCGDLKNYLVDLRKQWSQKICQNRVFFADDSDGAYIEAATTSSSHLPSTTEALSTHLEEELTPPASPLTSASYIEADPLTPMTPLMSHFNNTLEKVLDHTELQQFALQIASGMAHLEKIPITHRDLAARNILINEHKKLKISDFGMSRDGPYINQKTKKFPLRWTALEAITEQKYDSRSDVWSFGVVLWEIGTLGASPYEKIPDAFLLQYLQMGHRLERPEICTDVLYDVMLNCWQQDPGKRPTFEELEETLDLAKRKVYVAFSRLNPLYVFPPTEIEN